MIAFLGMGLLGSNFVKALRKRNEAVQVWNRTASRAKALEADGAVAFENVADAVRGAERVHIVVKDDAAVDEVLAAALPGLQPGAIIIDHTTTSKEGAIARTAAWKEKGFTYMHVPVFMGPANALDSTGYMLTSGDQALIQKMQPVLAAMTGKVLNLGSEVGRGAALKLIGNLFLVTFTAGLVDTFALAKSMDVPVEAISDLFKEWSPANALPLRIQRMTAGDYSKPSWELNMARKDTQLFMNEADKAGVSLSIIPAIAALMDQWIEKGHGNEDWTVIGSANVK
ncbi:3-hydroxyisobutyrate dehydrogenase [Chitinophaga dinghuensis]|uniref:3-hydroxyisobutyrate dehydrogenase n=1 Tax=Chitinophaga dinghuensis TaxID=1539050 RepID=A0A327W151_9BACT|nr:NAD(P)-dependent oxidoreductase [Chitinophaga dinghuensis]RAJ81965.1 3-hydroxyisobutyrate dehydrogenase [Chitinophaga dinghuensis]